jgi:single-stranded-DNA-specific exonuclease
MTIQNQLPLSKWNLNAPIDLKTEKLLSKEFGIHPIISQIIMNRGFQDIDTTRRYLYPSLNDLHSPFLLKDIRKGVSRLMKALQNKEKIVIYGDYDADGITSVVILYKFIKLVTPLIDYYIPDRIQEGYGLKIPSIDQFKREGISLIITVDCGISDVEQVAHAQSIGIDTIILDHHEISGELPPAAAAINPNREDCLFPFKGLAGVGIAYNFLIALRGALNKEGFWKNRPYPNLKEYLDIVSLGTIGDIAPLIDENRILTKIGLELITEGQRPGIKALKEVSGVDGQVIDSFKASYSLIPRINAAGRIASPADAVKLLLTDDLSEARVLAEKLDSYNRQRQQMEKKIISDILEIVRKGASLEKMNSLVFSSDQWHPGIIGIVASRLVELFNRPAFVISLQDGLGKGSGRSVSGFNIYKGIQQCAHLLLSYGGHYHAAGISIKEENIDEFTSLLDEITRSNAELSDMSSQLNIDAESPIDQINAGWISQLELLAPFGSRNPEPLLYARNVKASSPTIVGNNHLKMRIHDPNASLDSIWFNMGKHLNAINGSTFDIVFTPQINNWSGAQDVQLKIKDIDIVSSNQ